MLFAVPAESEHSESNYRMICSQSRFRTDSSHERCSAMNLFRVSGMVALISAGAIVGGLFVMLLDKRVVEKKRQYLVSGAVLGAMLGMSGSAGMFLGGALPVPFSDLPLDSQLFIITVISISTWFSMVFFMWGTRKYIDFLQWLRARLPG